MSPRYQVKGKIGEGGLGEVYLATDAQLDRDVALKRVRVPEEGETASSDQDLLREARTLSALQHPNIVTIYDVGKDEKGLYVVMELLKGETLDEVAGRGALTEDDFREVVVQSLEGMIAAQSLGLVHRDLKPGNLMVIWLASGKFQVKILDFGLAKFSRTAVPQTQDQHDAIMGSIFFMAPEQFERLPLDARTDMYSLGCIFYQALTTKYPFDGQTGPEVMVSHLQHHVRHLHEERPDLPVWMADWVMWLISRDMDERPADARSALEYFRANRPGLKNPTPQPPKGPVVRIVGRGAGPGGRVTQPMPVVEVVSGPGGKRKHGGKSSKTGLWIALALAAAAGGGGVWYSKQKTAKGAQENPALESLARETAPVADEGTLEILFEAVEAGDRQAVRAAEIMRRMKDPKLGPAVANRLKSAKDPARLILIEVAAAHPTKEGLALLLKIASAESGPARTAALEAIGKAAKPEDTGELFKLLPALKDPAGRAMFFQIVEKVLSASEDPAARIKPLVDALPSATDDSRPELLKMLSRSPDPAASAAVGAEVAAGGERRRAALVALAGWVVPDAALVDGLFSAAKAPEDREIVLPLALRFSRLVSTWNAAELTERLKSVLPLVTNNRTREALTTALGATPGPEAQQWIEALSASENQEQAQIGVTAAGTQSQLQELITPVTPGEVTLDSAKAKIQGTDNDAYFTSTSRYITNWKEADTRVSWDLQFDQPGQVNVEVLQSTGTTAPRVFRVRLGESLSERPVEPTPSNEDFKVVDAGPFTIPRPGIWRLWLEPVRMADGQSLFNVRDIILRTK